MYCLDTDIIISVLRGDKELKKKVESIRTQDVIFTTITLCELFQGAYKAKDTVKALDLVYEILRNYKLLSLDTKSAEIFGMDFNKLEKEGKKTQDFDLLIAGIAKANNLILVTRNKRHFENIPDLRLEGW